MRVLSEAAQRHHRDRKSTRLNSSHDQISYAVFCLKKKKHTSELQSRSDLVCRLLLEKKKTNPYALGLSVIIRIKDSADVQLLLASQSFEPSDLQYASRLICGRSRRRATIA